MRSVAPASAAIAASTLLAFLCGRWWSTAVDGVGATALLLGTGAAWAAVRTAIRRAGAGHPTLLPSATAWASAAAVATGSVSGVAGAPGTGEAGWLFATASAVAALLAIHAALASGGARRSLGGALSTPAGIIVFGQAATGVAWRDPRGTVRARRLPAGWRGLAGAVLLLLWQPVIRPLLGGQRPSLQSLRRLHGAEHLAVVAALEGRTLHAAALRTGEARTPLCGGTLAAWGLLLWAPLSLVPRSDLEAALVFLWALSWASILRTLALAHACCAALLAPGLWLQRWTVAAPEDGELATACAAVRAAVEEVSCGGPAGR